MPNGNKKATVHAAKNDRCHELHKCLQGHFIGYGSLVGKDAALDANGTEIDPHVRHILS